MPSFTDRFCWSVMPSVTGGSCSYCCMWSVTGGSCCYCRCYVIFSRWHLLLLLYHLLPAGLAFTVYIICYRRFLFILLCHLLPAVLACTVMPSVTGGSCLYCYAICLPAVLAVTLDVISSYLLSVGFAVTVIKSVVGACKMRSGSAT